MKTRVAKWKKYRAEIESNFLSRHTIINSNPELKDSLSQLITFFPDIEEKILANELQSSEKLFFEERLNELYEYQITEVEKLLMQLQKIEELSNVNLAYLNKINFSSNQLDHLIKKLEQTKKD